MGSATFLASLATHTHTHTCVHYDGITALARIGLSIDMQARNQIRNIILQDRRTSVFAYLNRPTCDFNGGYERF